MRRNGARGFTVCAEVGVFARQGMMASTVFFIALGWAGDLGALSRACCSLDPSSCSCLRLRPARTLGEVPHGQVHPVLGGGIDVMVSPGRGRELRRGEDAAAGATEYQFQRGQLGLAGVHHRQHRDVTGLLLLPLDEVADWLLAEFVVQGQQVCVEDEQVSLHVHHALVH
jgi:hypothetical protein